MMDEALEILDRTSDGRKIAPDRLTGLRSIANGPPALGERFATKSVTVDLNTAQPYGTRFVAERSTMALHLDPRDDEMALDSDRLIHRQIRPGTATVVGKGSSVKSRSGSVDGEFIALTVDDQMMEDILSEFNMRCDNLPTISVLEHPDLTHHAKLLRSFMLNRENHSEVYGETLVLASTMALASAIARRVPAGSDTKLCADQLKLVRDMIEANLEEPLTVQFLADHLDIPIYRFMREFKARTGQSPHQYIIDRRINFARSMLESTADSLADISYAAGFSSQSHMTTLFKTRLGVTPGTYRRERGR